ncbi:MAG: type II and III secretion system protein [Gemmataceae bacterium]|nr:type II and III secretion system protein [Gemmataceae bacterium]
MVLSAGAASAQEKPRLLVIAVGETKREGMSRSQKISKVFNEKSNVVRVEAIKDDATAVIVSGLAPGTSRIEFTDGDNNVELLDVLVTPEAFIIPRVQQVELEVVVAVVQRSEIRRISFNWVENRANYFIGSLIGATGGASLLFNSAITTGVGGALQSASGTPNLQFGVVGDRHSFLGFLEALRTEQLAKVLSEPRVTTLSGQKADILSGGEVPVVLVSSVGSPPTVQYKPFGTTVEFTPVVMENGKIQITVAAELSNRNAANDLNVPGAFAPGFDTRRARSVIQMEDGQTLAIGGLIQNTIGALTNKVPILGDIPFLGTAFSSTRYEEREEEMIILVTPRLVAPMNCTQLPHRLPGRETRSPDDFELFLTQILEAPRGQREVCPDGRFRAAHMNGPTAGLYPCNDNSQRHSWGHGANCGPNGCYPGYTASSGSVSPVLGAMQSPPPDITTAPAEPMTEAAPAAAPLPVALPPEAPALPPLPEGRPAVPATFGPAESR